MHTVHPMVLPYRPLRWHQPFHDLGAKTHFKEANNQKAGLEKQTNSKPRTSTSV
jgi:hypothetical protein